MQRASVHQMANRCLVLGWLQFCGGLNLGRRIVAFEKALHQSSQARCEGMLVCEFHLLLAPQEPEEVT